MSISTVVEFVQSLIPRMVKDDVITDIGITIQEFETLVLPVVSELRSEKKNIKFKSGISKNINASFNANYKGKGKGHLIDAIGESLPNVIANMKSVRDSLDSSLEADVITAGLTAEKATLLRVAEHGAFMTDYCLDVISCVISDEVESKSDIKNDDIPPIKLRKLTENASNFGMLLTAYSIDPKLFKDKLASIPPVTFNAETATLIRGTYGDSSLDPFNAIVTSNFTGNPFYHLRMVWEEYQNKRFRAKADKKKMLELKVLQLKHLNDGRNDPKVESQIKYIQNRINELEYEMEKMKE